MQSNALEEGLRVLLYLPISQTDLKETKAKLNSSGKYRGHLQIANSQSALPPALPSYPFALSRSASCSMLYSSVLCVLHCLLHRLRVYRPCHVFPSSVLPYHALPYLSIPCSVLPFPALLSALSCTIRTCLPSYPSSCPAPSSDFSVPSGLFCPCPALRLIV